MTETDSRILEVVKGHLAAFVADTALMTLLDDDVDNIAERYSTEAAERVPAIYWYLLPRTMGENTEECVVRYDIAARTTAVAIAIENRVVALTHFNLPVVINDVGTFSQFRQSIDLNDEGRLDDYARRVVEILIQPLRHKVEE